MLPSIRADVPQDAEAISRDLHEGLQRCDLLRLASTPGGAIERDHGQRELYRTVFIPIGANLVFGTYNSLLTEPGNRSSRRLADPFVGSLLSLIREIQAEGIAAPGGIAAALNARGFRPVRGRS